MKPCFFVKSSLGQPKIPTLIPAITNQTNVWMGRGCFRFKSGCVGRFQKPRYWAFSLIGLSKSSLGCFLSLSPFVHTHSRPNNQMATNDLHKSSAGCAPCRGRGERGGLKHAAVAAEPTNSIRFTTGITDLFLAPSLLVKLTLTRSTHVGERL